MDAWFSIGRIVVSLIGFFGIEMIKLFGQMLIHVHYV